MKSKRLLLLLLLAIGLPWAANGQNTITLTGNVTQTIAPNTTYDFYDSGGPNSNYGNSQNYTATLTCVGDITINFSQFETENSSGCSDWDHMHIYDGTASTGTLLARGQSGCTSTTLITGTNYVATSGTMTIVWKSDSGTNKAGWAATITGGAAPACPKPTNLTCTATTGTPTATATFTWTHGGTETDWVLEYGTASDFTGATSKSISQSDLVNGAYTLNTGLTAETKYYARIKADCGGDESNWSDAYEFKPSNVQTVEIGSGETTNSYLPAYTYNNNTLSEQIYTAAEIGMAGTINSIAFYNAGSTKNPNFKVYLVHTDKTAFSSATDWLTVTAGDLVFEGNVTLTTGQWTTIEFDTEFEFDGCSNLGLVVDENMSYSSGLACRVFSSTDNCSMYVTSDGTNYNAVGASYSGSRLSVKNQLQLGILPNLKPSPNNLALVDGSLSQTSATLEWQAPCIASPTGYEYQYKIATDQWPDTWTSNGTNLSMPLSGLTASTTYDFRVRATYAEGESDPAEIQFTTEATCLPVTNITVSDITSNSAKLAWDDPNGAASWQYITLAHGDTPDWTSQLVITSNTNTNVPANILAGTGQEPQPNTEYDFYVRAHCGGGDYSEAVMLTFRTACGTITNFPWTEIFNSYSTTATSYSAPSSYPNDVMPDCWTFLNRSETSDTYPQVFLSSYSDYAVSGNCLFFKSSSTTPLYAVLPEFSNRIAGLKLTFTYRNESTGTSNGILYVGYMTDPNDANTFNEQDQIACSQTTTKTTVTVRFANAPDGSHFAFKYQGGTANNYYLSIDDVIVEERVLVIANQVVNEGNVFNDYQMTWDQFAEHVNNGHEFIDAISLMEDITINTMVGTEAHPFMGTFNGQGYTITMADGAFGNSTTYTSTERCAPFQRTQGATIRNLNTTGSIYTSAKCAAGLIGYTEGNCTITNCSSDVIITSTVSDDGTHAGLIAVTKGGTAYSSTIEGCAFSGKLLGESTGGSAGLVGYNNQVLTVTNCVVAPTEVTMTCAGQSSATFVRNGGTLNINNSYYNNITFGGSPTLQGKEMFSITGVSPVTVASSESSYDYYSVSDISAYTTGFMYKGTIYAGEGETLTLTLSGAPGYEANHGTLEASGANYTLLMEAYNTEISGVDCPVPFNVAANDVTATSAKIAWEGNSDTYKLMYRNVITPAFEFDETYDFEDGDLQGWTTESNDADNNAWSIWTTSGYAHGGTHFVRSRYTSSGDGEANDWLISPQIPLGGTFSFYARRYSTSYTDRFQVYVSTTGNNISDFTAISEVITPNPTYDLYEYDLSSYSGYGYVAIVYTAPNNQYYVYVDDIHITASIEGEYGEWQTVNPAVSAQPIGSLTPETTYQVKVSGFCNGVETDKSQVVEFTTPATCPAPTALAVTENSVTAHEATITWTENGEATTWIVEYADDADFTNASSETVEDDATYSFDELDGETTYYVRVKAHCGEEDESYYSNVVSFTTLVACQAPTVLTVTEGSVTTNQVELSWTENGTATAWQICLNGDETNLIAANSNPFTLESLTAATSYTVKVRANCGGIDGESAWSNEVSFTTDCDAITNFPWIVDFEGFTAETVPNCWDNSASTSSTLSGNPQRIWGVYSYSDNKMLRMYNYFVQNGTALINTPDLVLPANAECNLTFDYSHTASCGDFIVKVSEDGGTTFTNLATYSKGSGTSYSDPGEFTPATISLAAYAGKTITLQFFATANFGSGAIFVDNVKIIPTFTKTIEAVGDENWEDGKGGYYLIASPLAEDVDPATVNGMLTADEGEGEDVVLTYDLYSFNQAQELEWQNYRASNFNLVNGTGYLYASKNGTTLTFSGVPYSGDGEVNLVYDSNAEEFAGWNLVGNPFGEDAYITKDFYTLENSDTYTPNTAGTPIHAMQGLLVVADEDGETLTFTPAEAPAGNNSKLNMNVSNERSVVDQAIISFNEGQQLPKLQFRNGSTKVYLPKDGKEYAIVSTEAMGTMPVNFKAENNGTYTLSFTAEEVSFAYLHLIDNMTGIETDLLANPSYSFDARTTDYESRFKLVFATGNNANDDTFAFYCNGSFVINNEGEATLQVIDVNGRILKSESINGCANVNVKAAAGVYMLRLVNGNDVKVQKVVVK